jgi:hypothetical protein
MPARTNHRTRSDGETIPIKQKGPSFCHKNGQKNGLLVGAVGFGPTTPTYAYRIFAIYKSEDPGSKLRSYSHAE